MAMTRTRKQLLSIARIARRWTKGLAAGGSIGHYDYEISAIQHAYGLREDNPDTFDAEYNNEPKPEIEVSTGIKYSTPMSTACEYCKRTNEASYQTGPNGSRSVSTCRAHRSGGPC